MSSQRSGAAGAAKARFSTASWTRFSPTPRKAVSGGIVGRGGGVRLGHGEEFHSAGSPAGGGAGGGDAGADRIGAAD